MARKRLKKAYSTKPTGRPKEEPWHKLRRIKSRDAMHNKLCRGEPAVSVATWLLEIGEVSDVAVATVTNWVKDYKKSIPKADFVQHAMTPEHQEKMAEVEEGLDALQELEWLYSLQKERIQIDFAIEKNIGKLFDNTYREVRTAMDILKSHQDLMMDLGLNQRHIGQVDVSARIASVAVQYGEDVSGVLEDPKKRHRVLSIGRRIHNMLANRAQEAEEVDDSGDVIDVSPELEI